MFPEWMRGKQYLKVSGWRLLIFGVILIVMMRFRPAGLLPEARRKHEIEAGMGVAAAGAIEVAGGANVAPHR
jgi:branched-chain amino acid transport system permease protein